MKILKSISIITTAVLIFLVPLFISVPVAHACSCVQPGSPQEMLEKSSAVFSGKVTNISRDLLGYGYKVNFDVEKIWKGFSDRNVVVSTGLGGGDCGFGFKEGERYIVYAYGENSLSTGICSRTHLLTEADTDVSVLGPGNLPAQDNAQNTKQNFSLEPLTIGAVLLALILIIIIYKLVLRKKPS